MTCSSLHTALPDLDQHIAGTAAKDRRTEGEPRGRKEDMEVGGVGGVGGQVAHPAAWLGVGFSQRVGS